MFSTPVHGRASGITPASSCGRFRRAEQSGAACFITTEFGVGAMVSADADAVTVANAGTELWVIDSKYCLPYETVLIFQEDFSWQKDADIKDTEGKVHFRLKAKAWSPNFLKVLLDKDDQPVCSLYQKAWSMRLRTWICPGTEPDPEFAYFEARKKVWTFTPVMEIYLRGNQTDTPDVTCKGDFTNRKFTLTSREGNMLAEITRKVGFKAAVCEVDSYYIRIMPRVDIAAVVAVVMCVDVIHAEEEHRARRK